jgi:2-polyprenyl-3-methyl-5-hydroxy-6-metoxy-1,4-benzoquinol methylase
MEREIVTNQKLILDDAGSRIRAPVPDRPLAAIPPHHYRRFLNHIVNVYDDWVIRSYCKIRFSIININILDMLALCLRGKRRVLDIGCGFGLFGCYFSALNPNLKYRGIDINSKRIQTARRAAGRLGLENIEFDALDARQLEINAQYDAILMIDLLHHIDDQAKSRLLTQCRQHLAPTGRLIIKDVTTHPALEIAFTWALDVLMTRGFEMWYWDEQRFYTELGQHFSHVETYPIMDWMPYPHIIYLCEKSAFE